MKKIIFFMLAWVMVASTAMAQGPGQGQGRQQRDPKEMAQRMTDRAVERYKLNADQAKKLLTVNSEFMTAMRGQRGQQGQRPDEATRAAWQKQREEYNAKVKKILTADQYKAWEKDQAEGRNGMNGRRGGQRGGGAGQGGGPR